MIKNIFRTLFTIIGLIIGFFFAHLLLQLDFFINFNKNIFTVILFYLIATVFFGLLLFLFSPIVIKYIIIVIEKFEKKIQRMPINQIVYGLAGALIGLLISFPIVSLFSGINVVGLIVAVFVYVIMAVIGADISVRKREDITNFFSTFKKSSANKDKKDKLLSKGSPKVLDTSVIIDGRIFDLCQTGFIEGTLIIPAFVLQELRHIADSSDNLKRNRGRRGLDILNKIQKELKEVDVQVTEKDFPQIAEVDSKLLKLAQELNGKVITNDYNLNKVAEFQGVPVLNINELANAIKPVVLPGEEMRIQIVKDGKESGQGVAYLDDGTMIVVEGGKKFIGETKDVVVTSVLQTAAGRMIFAKQKEALGV
ncbi:MAG: PIN/TRAM domain-containing protein [Bacillota bacterium]|nr:PIN/TRAM domain-containing protein [Bacillota bacterium]